MIAQLTAFTFQLFWGLALLMDSAQSISPCNAGINVNSIKLHLAPLFVYKDQRYRYDTHGNLVEKRIAKHTIIAL